MSFTFTGLSKYPILLEEVDTKIATYHKKIQCPSYYLKPKEERLSEKKAFFIDIRERKHLDNQYRSIQNL
jgi:hypothetical protein